MRSKHFIWLSLVLLPVLLDRSDCIGYHARRQYRLTYKLSKFQDYNTPSSVREVCDNTTGRARRCDLRVKMWVVCDSCEHSPPIYYPSINGSYEDAVYLDSTNEESGIDREKRLSVDGDMRDDIVIRVVAVDVDLDSEKVVFDRVFFNYESLRISLNLCISANGSISCNSIQKVSAYHYWNRLELELTYHIECAPSTCGETCVLPDESFACINGKVACLTNKFDSSCELSRGNFPGRFELLSYKTNHTARNQTVQKDCYDVLSVCASEFWSQFCYQHWACARSELLDASLVREGDDVVPAYFVTDFRRDSFFGRVKFETYCLGEATYQEEHEFKVSVYGDTIIRVNGSNRYAVGVFKSGCERKFAGFGPSCAYEKICPVNKCLNGGTCLMGYKKLDADERRVFIHLQENGVSETVSWQPDVYTAVCQCASGFKGSECEEYEDWIV